MSGEAESPVPSPENQQQDGSNENRSQEQQEQETQSNELWNTFAKRVMAAPTGCAAAAALPDVPWVDIMKVHILHVMTMQLDRPITEIVAADIPALAEQARAHPLHAAAASGRVPASHSSVLLISAPHPAGEGLRANFYCDVRDGYGRSAVHWASSAGQADWIAALLSAGADPNLRDRRSMRPLHDAVAGGNVAAARTLLERGADVNCKGGGRGHTPLHVAAMHSNVEIVKLLCEAGACVEMRDRGDGFTPLMSAAAKGNLEAAEALLEYGVDTETEVRV